MEIDKKFGAFLKNRRKDKGLSQYQLGKLLGVSDRAVSKWETGLSKPNSKLLVKIGEIFCVSTDELLGANLTSADIIQMKITKKCNDLWRMLDGFMADRYGLFPDIEVVSRYQKEKLALLDSNLLLIMNFISLLKSEAQTLHKRIKVMGGIGSSFIAFLLGLTEIDPLPPHYYCPKCKTTEFITDAKDGWDLPSKKCKYCHTVLERNGHNIPFEVYKHVIHGKAGFDILICRSFFDKAEQFIIDMLNDYSLTIVSNPLEVYHGKIAADAITYVIQPIVQKRYVQKMETVPTVNDYFSIISNHHYINYLFDNSFEKMVELENLVNIPYERVRFYEPVFLGHITKENSNEITFSASGNELFHSMLKKYSVETFDELLHLFGIIMLSEEYPDVLESLFENFPSLDEAIVYRDDLFFLICSSLRANGCYDAEIAYTIVNNARRGDYYRKVDTGTHDLLMRMGIQKSLISHIESIRFLFSKAAGLLYLWEQLVLVWYKLHYPNEYSEVYNKK